jgi:hypothetical protein
MQHFLIYHHKKLSDLRAAILVQTLSDHLKLKSGDFTIKKLQIELMSSAEVDM